ncbi:phosphopantetheine-binding protein [Micromonospora sp. NBC_01392]|uniref:phosphopantetheine-binding protein n=1 Tax=Micromonospora sp. NBC_01392 TaxID=2903588 RepID=UPI00324394BD
MSAVSMPRPDDGESSDSHWLQAFREVLNSTEVDDDTDFFEGGGHSMLIPKLLLCYESLSGCRPPIRLVFEFSTPRELEAEMAMLQGGR